MSRTVQLVQLSALILTCLQTGAAQHVISDSDVERISTAVLQQLLPYINRIEANLRRDLTSLINEKVTSIRESVSEDLIDYKNQTASDLESLQSNTTRQLTQLSTKMDAVESNLVSVNSELEQTILSNLTQQLQKTSDYLVQDLCAPVPSRCSSSSTPTFLPVTQTLKPLLTSLPLLSSLLQPTQITFPIPSRTSLLPSPTTPTPYPTCTCFPISLPLFSCGGTGGWRRVVYLNFTDPNTPCPSGWQLTSHSKRTCGRLSNSLLICDSVTFPVSGEHYTRVCGRIIAYQHGGTEGFEAYDTGRVTTINGSYVSGVSLTHGSPRQHIWTFAAGYSEHTPTYNDACPCDTTINITIPPFVGEDYLCESGRQQGDPFGIFYSDDPLWDGAGCTASSTCCSFNDPPYFTKQLPSPTTDDIEARLCHYYAHEDTPIEFIELYVQ